MEKRNLMHISYEINFLKDHFYCEECHKYIDEDDLDDKYCPVCGIDVTF